MAERGYAAAIAELAPVLDGVVPVFHPIWQAKAFLLEAIARDALGDWGAVEKAPERLLELAEPEELYVSRHTVKTHIRHVYEKLGAHRRTEAVTCARSLGLLAPSAHAVSGRR